MNKNMVGKFMKVSRKIFIESLDECMTPNLCFDKDKSDTYENIKLPKRATKFSAGYDFFLPFGIHLEPNETCKIPTGIRVKIDESWVLMCFPRSGLGFKYGMRLINTVGIIDSDYFMSDNEGHIFLKITNGSDKTLQLMKGDAFAQGIFLPYGITEDDDVDTVRNGGMGSTSK